MSENNNQPGTGAVSAQINKLFCAIQFLTVFPVRYDHSETADPFRGVVYYFVIVGALIGGMASAVYWIASLLLPVTISAAITVIFMSAVSGFIHLDGLADTADGFLSNKDRTACLEIMRDSRVGVMGAAVIGMVLLLKYSTLSSQDIHIDPTELFLVPITGRAAIVYSMALLPYARSSGGLGTSFYSEDIRRAAVVSFVLLCLVTLLMSPGKLLVYTLVPVMSVVIFSHYCRVKIGGATGDTLGAACEITETVVLISLSFNFMH